MEYFGVCVPRPLAQTLLEPAAPKGRLAKQMYKYVKEEHLAGGDTPVGA